MKKTTYVIELPTSENFVIAEKFLSSAICKNLPQTAANFEKLEIKFDVIENVKFEHFPVFQAIFNELFEGSEYDSFDLGYLA